MKKSFHLGDKHTVKQAHLGPKNVLSFVVKWDNTQIMKIVCKFFNKQTIAPFMSREE